MIEYYYGFYNITLHKHDEQHTFSYQDNTYIFSILKRNENDISEIFKYTSGNDYYDQIVVNKYNSIFTDINGTKYIMVKKTSRNLSVENIVFCSEYLLQVFNHKSINNRLNWGELWCRKIDNIEYQLRHIENKYPLIEKSIDYYIGMTESAISYINNISYDDYQEDKVITHIRIYDKSVNNPQNIILDYRSRDISEYLKYVFIKNKYDYDFIREKLSLLNFSEFSWQLVYSRLFFPNFYFDIYDKVIINKLNEESIYSIIDRIEEYEIYLDSIYDIICEQKKIPKIIWN